MNNNTLTALVLAALDDSAIKALNERVNELAELGFKPQIVDELPAEGNDHTLYLVPQNEPGEDPWYYEYLWLDNEWEKIGTTSVNFDDYYKKAEIDTILEDYSTWEDVESIREQLESDIDNVSDRVDNLTDSVYTKDETYNKDEIDTILDDYYTKTEIDNTLDDYYTKTETDDILDDYYTKTEVDTALDDYYTKDEVDSTLDDYYTKDEVDNTLDDYYTKSEVDEAIAGDLEDYYDKTEIDAALDTKQDVLTAGDNVDITNDVISVDLSDYLAKDNTTAYTPIGNYNPATKQYVDQFFFDGTSEEWDALTDAQKEYFKTAVVEDYVQLDIAETYDINSVLGLDPQEEIISDMYEEEAIDLTNQIIGGSF